MAKKNTKKTEKNNVKSKKAAKPAKAKDTYDCSKCPGTCCSFPVIELSEIEARRMAEAKKLSISAFKKRFLVRNKHKPDNKANVWIFKHKKHPTGATKTICTFYAKDTGCTMYESRPETCRTWGDDGKCLIYDFLGAMREHTDDPNYVFTRLEL